MRVTLTTEFGAGIFGEVHRIMFCRSKEISRKAVKSEETFFTQQNRTFRA